MLKKEKKIIKKKIVKIKKADLLPESRSFLEMEKEEELAAPVNKITPEDMEKEDKYKDLIMWSGVSFFMILIIFGWFLNFKNAFRQNEVLADDSQAKSLDQITEELKNNMSKVKEQMEAIKQTVGSAATTTVETAATTAIINQLPQADTATATPSSEDIKKLKEKLENTIK